MSGKAIGDYCEPMNPEMPPDLDAIERDLADVEEALARLDTGAYWTDEVTGERIPDAVLARNPLARRKNG